MKPHEEEWTIDFDEYGGYDCMTSAYVIRSADGYRIVAVDTGLREKHDETAQTQAKLISAAPDMARLLLSLEWAGERGYEGESDPACYFCKTYEGDQHKDDCAWVAVMKKAGLR